MDANSLTSRIGNPLPTAMPLELRERVGFTPAHARGPDPRVQLTTTTSYARSRYSKLHGIIGKRAFETDHCASRPGTAILAFKPHENQVNIGSSSTFGEETRYR